MATRYHFNKETGRTGKCEAKIKCRLGLAESEHFSTREEAQQAYEKTMDSKTANQTLKKRSTTPDVDTHNNFTDKDGRYSELNGKNAAEIRKHIIDIHDKYAGKEPEIQKNIAKHMGLSNIPGFEDDYRTTIMIDRGGYFEVERNVHVSYDQDYNDYRYYDDSDVDSYIEPEYQDIEGYKEARLEVVGYYNEDSYVNYRYELPEAFADDLDGLKQLDKYERLYERAACKNLPDWAAIPETMTMNGKDKSYSAKDWPKNLTKPNSPDARIKKLNKIVNSDQEADRLLKANRKLYDRSNAAVEKLHELSDYERSDNKRGFVFRHNPEYRGMSVSKRRSTRENLERTINTLNTNYVRNVNKLDVVSSTKQHDKDLAQNRIDDLQQEFADAKREYAVKKLSNYYPHSQANVRKQAAEKWIEKNPAAVDEIFDLRG